MKKTLLVTLDFYPQVGGVASYWQSLLAHMPADRMVVLAPLLPQGARELEVGYTMYRRRLLDPLSTPHWWPLFWHIWQIVRREKIECIVVGQILPVGTVVWLLARMLGVKHIVSTHAMDVAYPLRWWHKKWLCAQIVRGADRVITVAGYTADLLVSLGAKRARIAFVRPCPVVTPALREGEGKDIVVEKRRSKMLLTVTRLVERKGVDTVIRALPAVLREVPDMEYVVVGNGDDRVRLEDLARECGVVDHVRCVGEADRAGVAAYMEACDVFIMVPRDIRGDVEAFGIVYLEANLFGKPVIGSRSGGIADAVVDGMTGLMVAEDDAEDAARAIVRLMRDEGLAARLGEQGRVRAERDFQWEVQARALVRVLG